MCCPVALHNQTFHAPHSTYELYIFIFSVFRVLLFPVPPHPPTRQNLICNKYCLKSEIDHSNFELSNLDFLKLHKLLSGVITTCWSLYSGLLFVENSDFLVTQHYNEIMFIFGTLPNIILNSCKLLAKFCFYFSIILIFSESVSPMTHFLCILVFQMWCHTCTKKLPQWLPVILILLANGVELNPGPQFQNNIFSFMNWNLNSIVQGNFERVLLIEAHNTMFGYDLFAKLA